jgi:prevent-host-death family protein
VAVEIGVRELRGNLSAWLKRVGQGEEVIVTARGRPVARIVPPERRNRLQELIEQGRVTPPSKRKSNLGPPKLPPLKGDKTLSDIVIELRRGARY